jgi:hypothetical protein
MMVRKNGATPTYPPAIVLGKEATAGVFYKSQVFVGLDANQVLQYKIYVGTGWQLDSRITVLGYSE